MGRESTTEVALAPALSVPKNLRRFMARPEIASAIAGAPAIEGVWAPLLIFGVLVLWPLVFFLPSRLPFAFSAIGQARWGLAADAQGISLKWFRRVVKTVAWSQIRKVSIESPAQGYWGAYSLVFETASGEFVRQVFHVERPRSTDDVPADPYPHVTEFLDTIEKIHGPIEGRERFEQRFTRGQSVSVPSKNGIPVRLFRSFEDARWQQGFSVGGLCLVLGGLFDQNPLSTQIGLCIFITGVVLAPLLAWLNIRLSSKRLFIDEFGARLMRGEKTLYELNPDQISAVNVRYRPTGWWDRSFIDLELDSPRQPSIHVSVNEEDVSDEFLSALESLAQQSGAQLSGNTGVRFNLHRSFSPQVDPVSIGSALGTARN